MKSTLGKRVHYFVSRKNAHHGQAIIDGFQAIADPAEHGRLSPDADLHIIGGLQFGSLELLREARIRGLRYLFIDRGYFGGGPRSDVLRVVRNAHQKHWIDDVVSAMATSAKAPPLQPWRAGGRHLLVVPPSDAVARLFGLGDAWRRPEEWIVKATRTTRPVLVSRKGGQAPLVDRLRDCWAVITYASNVAVEAVCAGVPVFCSMYSAARPVGNDLADIAEKLEAPWMPPDHHRQRWAESLARGQFTVDEIRAGAARHLC